MNSSDGIAADPRVDVRAPLALLARSVRSALSANGTRNSSSRGIMQVAVEVEDVEPLRWLEAQSADEKVFWEGRSNAFAVAGVGVADCIRLEEPLELDEVCRRIRREMTTPAASGSDVRYYGGMRFNPEGGASAWWRPFGTAHFVLPRFELRREEETVRLICNLIPEVDQERRTEIVDSVHRLAPVGMPEANGHYCPEARTDLPDHIGWTAQVKSVLDLFHEDHEKVVLAREVGYDFERPLRAETLFQAVKDATPGAFHFLVQPEAGTAFVGASPERLFSKCGWSIYSEAVAGTRPRGATPDEDRRMREALLSSEKDLREHRYVWKSLAAGLKDLCTSLSVDEGVSELKLPRSWHLITRLRGSLHPSVSSLNVLAALHPSPAVGGWPTDWAIEKIEEHEAFDRGWYAGPVGWLGEEDAEFAVAIRSGLVTGRTLRLYSGAGIVEGSDPGAEWNEIEQKIGDFIDALGLDC